MSTDVIDEFTEDVARSLLVERFGPQCASWIVWEHKYMLHRRGVFQVVVPDVDREGKAYAPPQWFELAVACLRKRPGWSVDVLRHRSERCYRFRWHAWSKNLPGRIPQSILKEAASAS